MPRLHASVAAHIEIPALLRRNDTHVLALCLGAFSSATGHGKLDFVRRAQSLVAIFQFDRETDAVLHAVAAPRRTDAGLHGAQCLAVGMARFETGRDEFLPDERQLMHLSAEEVDALTAGYLGVETESFGDLSDGNEFFRRNFPARYARHDR